MHETQMNRDAHVLEREVARYLATGESDPLAWAFPGDHALERMIGYERHFRAQLVAEVRRREHGHRQPQGETLGLPHTRSKEWLLDIAYAKRETFAYACETYGRIVDQAQGTAGRRALLTQYARSPKPSDETVDSAELLDILTEAIETRNGWKRILARCSSSSQPVPRSALTCT